MKKFLLEIVYWTWCLPQTLVGLIVKLIFKGKKITHFYYEDFTDIYSYNCGLGSISLGKYVLLCRSHMYNKSVIKHELGHRVQSFILGPLYLIVIGLPSLIWAGCFEKYRSRHKVSYYDFYTEAWANKIAKVHLV